MAEWGFPPLAGARPRIVCGEMRPVPEKAVWLEEKDVVNGLGETVHVQQPHVIGELCVGCGSRVYATDSVPSGRQSPLPASHRGWRAARG